MTALHPQMLTLMQDLSGWVLTDRFGDAAAALGRWSETAPAFAPWAAGASAIAWLPTGNDFKRRGFLQLLTSTELVPILTAASTSEPTALIHSFRIGGTWGLQGPEKALHELCDGLLQWDAPTLRAIFGGVIEAGGLGDLALTLEKRGAAVSGRDFERARHRLHEMTRRFAEDLMTGRESFEQRIPEMRSVLATYPLLTEGARAYVASEEATPRLWDVCLIVGLRSILDPEIHARPDAVPASLVTDLLHRSSKRRRGAETNGLPESILFAHMAHAASVKVASLMHNSGHVSLALEESPLAIGVARHTAVLRTLTAWRSMGLLGQGQSPGPLSDLLSGTVNLSFRLWALREQDPAMIKRGCEAALKLAPQHFASLINKAHMERGNAAEVRRVIAQLTALDPHGLWKNLYEAYALNAEKRRRAAMDGFEDVFSIALKKGVLHVEQQPVPLLSDEYLEVAISDYVDLCVAERKPLRATQTLIRLTSYPSHRIRESASALLLVTSQGKHTGRA